MACTSLKVRKSWTVFRFNSTLRQHGLRVKSFVVLVWNFFFSFIDSVGLTLTHSMFKSRCLVELFIQVNDNNSHGFLQLIHCTALHHVPRPMCFTTYPNHPMQFFSYSFAIWQNQNGISKLVLVHCTAKRKKNLQSFALLPMKSETNEESKRVGIRAHPK